LVLQGFIGSSHAPSGLLRATAPLFAGGLALTGALAAACFVKAFAVAFLALPRSTHAQNATEASSSQRLAQNALAAACVVLGLGAPWMVSALSHVGSSLDPRFPWVAPGAALGGGGLAQVQPLALALAGLALGGGIYWYLGRGARTRATVTWACGQGSVEGRAAYTASAFANPIRRIFSNLYQFERATEPVEGVPPYFVTRSKTRMSIAPLFDRYLYGPALKLLRGASERLAPWSSPTVNRGLIVFAAVVFFLLAWAAS
ncbi:MAG: hypothetical protein ACYC8T_12520, partial [Myxococcaceae bacterium]